MKKIIIHEEAEKELWHSVDYYEDKVAGLGLDFEYEIQKALLSIQRHPNMELEDIYFTDFHFLSITMNIKNIFG